MSIESEFLHDELHEQTSCMFRHSKSRPVRVASALTEHQQRVLSFSRALLPVYLPVVKSGYR